MPGKLIIPCVSRQRDDVLDRYYQAAKSVGADVVIRITADCPFLDPAVVDQVISAYMAADCDYASNAIRCTYPDGLDTEVFSFEALAQAWQEASKPSEREHVTLIFGFPAGSVFVTLLLTQTCRVAITGGQWTKKRIWSLRGLIYAALSGQPDFGMNDILKLLEHRPELAALNGSVIMNEGYYRSLYAQADSAPRPARVTTQSQEWLERAQKVIPGAAQTFSKGYTQYVRGVSPVFLQRGKGCRVWDVDGNEYIDYVQGLPAEYLRIRP